MFQVLTTQKKQGKRVSSEESRLHTWFILPSSWIPSSNEYLGQEFTGSYKNLAMFSIWQPSYFNCQILNIPAKTRVVKSHYNTHHAQTPHWLGGVRVKVKRKVLHSTASPFSSLWAGRIRDSRNCWRCSPRNGSCNVSFTWLRTGFTSPLLQFPERGLI